MVNPCHAWTLPAIRPTFLLFELRSQKEENKMAARSQTLVCLVALSFAGCASSGTQVRDSQLTQFQEGVTTESDVVRALGPPTAISSNSNGSAVLVYTGAHAQAKAATFIPIVGLFAGGATAEATSVGFRFGPDHRLIDYQVTHGTTDVSMWGARTSTTNLPLDSSVPPTAPPVAAAHTPDMPTAVGPDSSHVRLGLHCTQVTPELAEAVHMPGDTGVRVATLEAGSVAEASGIKVGDVLLKYGDRPLNQISDLTAAIAATTTGATIPITVWRTTGESVVDVRF
jgi:hypothetical protein